LRSYKNIIDEQFNLYILLLWELISLFHRVLVVPALKRGDAWQKVALSSVVALSPVLPLSSVVALSPVLPLSASEKGRCCEYVLSSFLASNNNNLAAAKSALALVMRNQAACCLFLILQHLVLVKTNKY
jgi:hypothetical protein